MERILITGCNGMVGQKMLAHHRLRVSKDVLLASSLRPVRGEFDTGNVTFQTMDITSREEVFALVKDFRPTVIIHAAALSQVGACEKERQYAYAVNVTGTRNLVEAAEQIKARIVYLSTDFIFDGTRGPYNEEDIPNPVNYYGLTKWEGEKVTMNGMKRWAIVRTILVYGYFPIPGRTNFAQWVDNSLSQGMEIRVVHDQVRMPTLAEDLVQAVDAIARYPGNGIFHISGPDQVSMYEFALRIAREGQYDPSLIVPVSTAERMEEVRRPPVTGFILTKARKLLNYSPQNIKQGIRIFLAQKRTEMGVSSTSPLL